VQLHAIGADLRGSIEAVVAEAGLSSYFQLRGRDCNLVYVARDRDGQPSQEFRTLVLQEFLERGLDAFESMHGAQEFLDQVRERETLALESLFADTDDPLDAVDANAPGNSHD